MSVQIDQRFLTYNSPEIQEILDKTQLCNIPEFNDFVVDIVLKEGVEIDFANSTGVNLQCGIFNSGLNKYQHRIGVTIGGESVSVFYKAYDTLEDARADFGKLLEGSSAYVVLRDLGSDSAIVNKTLSFNRDISWSSLNEHPVIKGLLMEQEVDVLQADFANINGPLLPKSFSGSGAAWANIWKDEDSPIPQGSLIENNSEVPVLAFDSYSTVQGEYQYITIPIGKSWAAEYPVYRLRVGDTSGNYSVKVYYPGNIVPQIREMSGKMDAVTNTLYGGSAELPTTASVNPNSGIPPRIDGSQVVAGFFGHYTVDLTGAYAGGYKKVRFYGFSYNAVGDITPGLIATGVDNNTWVVESYVPAVDYQAGYFELPLTADSATLVVCILTTQGKNQIGSSYPEGTNLDYIPATVQLLNEESTGVVVKVGELDTRVTALEGGGGGSAAEKFPDTYMPKKVYGVIGDTLQIFRRSVVVSNDPYRQYLDFICGQGKVYERYLEITPEKMGGVVPTGLTIKHSLIADDFSKSEEQTSNLVLADRPSTSPASNINVLCMGASTTASGQWASELKRRLTGTRGDGHPAADGLTNITFVGRKELAAASGQRPVAIKVEATGGWVWKSFYTPKTAFRFQVSGVTSADIGTAYTYLNSNGDTVSIIVAEVNVTSGSGNIRFIYDPNYNVTGAPAAASGTLTRQLGSGDATIAYSSFTEETYCPFYDEQTGQPDFSNYASRYCNNNIDVLIAYMGNVNESIRGDSADTLIATRVSEMKTLLDAFHADFPNGKVIIGIAALANPWYGYEYNYSAASMIKTWSLRYGLYRYAKAVETFLQGDSYKDWCFLANTHTEVDSENGYPTATKPANTRTSRLDVIGTNGAHPILAGLQQVADSFYRCFVNTIL